MIKKTFKDAKREATKFRIQTEAGDKKRREGGRAARPQPERKSRREKMEEGWQDLDKRSGAPRKHEDAKRSPASKAVARGGDGKPSAPRGKSLAYNSRGGVCALYRALSKMSVCSRTAAKEVIQGGRVRVNGAVIKDPMHGVCLGKDRINVDGQAVREKKLLYLAFNKPAGYETSLRASVKSAKTIYDLIPFAKSSGLNPAGRLDKESRGLIILTNDNRFLNEISGGDAKLAKFYIVKTNADLDETQMKEFASGIEIDDGRGDMVVTRPCAIKKLTAGKYEVILEQGLNRQIRKMFDHFGVRVTDLFRYRIGKLKIEDDSEGSYFTIKPEEVIGAPAAGRTDKKRNKQAASAK